MNYHKVYYDFTLSGKNNRYLVKNGRVFNVDTEKEYYNYIAYEGGYGIFVVPSLHFSGDMKESRHSLILLDGQTYPLELFCSVLFDPKKVRASMSGIEVAPPLVHRPPEIKMLKPETRVCRTDNESIELEVMSDDSVELIGFDIECNGNRIEVDENDMTFNALNGKYMATYKKVMSANVEHEVNMRIRAVNKIGLLSKPARLTIIHEGNN